MDALEDCCCVGNPNNPRDKGSMESAKEELRDAINDSDLTNDQKQAASDRIDNMPKGPTASESQQSAEQARNDANEANSQASQNNPDQAQSALDNAVDNLNDASIMLKLVRIGVLLKMQPKQAVKRLKSWVTRKCR